MNSYFHSSLSPPLRFFQVRPHYLNYCQKHIKLYNPPQTQTPLSMVLWCVTPSLSIFLPSLLFFKQTQAGFKWECITHTTHLLEAAPGNSKIPLWNCIFCEVGGSRPSIPLGSRPGTDHSVGNVSRRASQHLGSVHTWSDVVTPNMNIK